MTNTNLSIIIVDDDNDDFEMLSEALIHCDVPKNKIFHANDGDKLFQVLENFNVTPCIIFMDLNMPKRDGREILKELKSSKYRHIPVLIFTTSASPGDIQTTYLNGTSTFFQKPSNYHDTIKLMQCIKNYWYDFAKISSF